MNNLTEALRKFDLILNKDYFIANEFGSNKMLEDEFEKLAETFIYKGHLLINERFKIYIRTAEFYFHTEDSEHNKMYVHDPVMFHRNKMDENDIEHENNVNFFTIGHFFLHKFGLDITFEKNQIYRAAALVKNFNIVDTELENVSSDYKDRTSSYIYDYIQFRKTNDDNSNETIDIKWIDDDVPQKIALSAKCSRYGIHKFRIDKNGIQTAEKLLEKDTRPWRYYRSEPYNKLKTLLEARKIY